MRRFLVPLILLALAACSQVPIPGADTTADLIPLTFGTSGYDEATGLARHSAGVYVVGGTFGNLHGKNKGAVDAFIRKYDTSGKVLWGKQFGTSSYDNLEGVASDSKNNAYVVGTTTGTFTGGGNGNHNGGDVLLRKYTPSGGVAWTRQFGTRTRESADSVAVYGNGVYVVGETAGSLAASNKYHLADVFIRKYNTSGGVVWTRQFGTSEEEWPYDVTVDGNGDVYIVGMTWGSLAATNGNGIGGADMFIRKYSASGSVLWTRQRDYGSYDEAGAVVVSGSGVYLFGASDSDGHLVKYTISGSLVWDKSYTSSEDVVLVNDASADSSGNLYVVGAAGEPYSVPDEDWPGSEGNLDGYVVKLNPSGTPLWGKTVTASSPSNLAYAVLARTDSEIYVAGSTDGPLGGTNKGLTDAYLRRLRGSDGSTVWTD